MLYWLGLGKTFKVKCPDGSVRIVYRNVDDAIPLYVVGHKSTVELHMQTSGAGDGALSREHESKIQGLLFQLNHLNGSIAFTFRAAYLGFQSHPCGEHNRFTSLVTEITRQHNHILKISVLTNGLINIARTADNTDAFVAAYRDIVVLMGPPMAGEAAVMAMKDSREATEAWGGQNAS